MYIIVPGSGERIAATPVSLEVEDKLATLAVDEPLPLDYATDRARLVAQSPWRLYFFWDFAHDPQETMNKALGEAESSGRQMIRLFDLGSGTVSLHPTSPSKNFWFHALPGHTYRAEVGILTSDDIFIKILSSAEATTPRARVSSRKDEAPEFRVSNQQFSEVLQRAGYVADAIEVSLEGPDDENETDATSTVAAQLTDAPLEDMAGDDLGELRRALAALALGISAEEIRRSLSGRALAWLDAAIAAGHDLSRSRVVDVMKETDALEYFDLDQLIYEIIPGTHRSIGPSEVEFNVSRVRFTAPGLSPSAPTSSNRR
jgi:hypothetical protein